ncbi:MAG: serine/threonine-protein kinase [Polyangia bacterium]
MDPMIGKVIDTKYRLVRLVGRGGMGAVYEAVHVRLGRSFAIKVMHPEEESPHGSVERLYREAMAASSIGHPNIVEIFDVNEEEDGTAFIAMELLKGTSLSDVIRAEGVVTPQRAIAFSLQILSALSAAHAKGIVHRDLKPDNVFVAVDKGMREVVKILDFGVAKVEDPREGEMELTKSGVVFGSPYYLAPEQARGRRDIDARADLWAAGVLLYYMLTGKRPFEGENYNEILGCILMEDPEPLSSEVPELPEALVEVVDRALEKDREERWSSADEMIDAILDFHDTSRDEMSTSVIRTLRGSDAPPAPVDPRFRVEIPAGISTSARRVDPASVTQASAAFSDRKRRLGRFGRIGIAAAGIGGVAIAFAVGALIFWGADSGSAREDDSAAAASADSGGAGDGTRLGEASGAIPADSEGGDAAADDSGEGEATIALEGLPDGARVTVDGREVEAPIVLPASGDEVLLSVTAGGFEPFSRKLVADRDRSVEVEMEPIEKRRKKRPVRGVQARKKKPREGSGSEKKKKSEDSKKGGKSWADNPFD